MNNDSTATIVKRLISISIPRSGHHLLVQLLWNYFKYGQFLYCEGYTTPGCCGRIPCEAVSRRAKSEFGTDSRLRLFMQKSHDLDYEVVVDPAARYLVQLREPAHAAIGFLRWSATYASRNGVSLGEIPKLMLDFLCYFVRFYHKWCLAGTSGVGGPDTHVIFYEQLVGSREKTREVLLRLLEWMNLPIEDESLEYSLEKSLTVDSHTNEVRNQVAQQYDLDYYDRLCGGTLFFLLEKLAAFCPGLPVTNDSNPDSASTSELLDRQLGELFFSVDLSNTTAAHLEFGSSERRLQPLSMGVMKGRPTVNPALGLRYGEKGNGACTVGDVVLLPLKISRSAQRLGGEIVFADADDALDLSKRLALSATLQGEFVAVKTSVSTHNRRAILTFDFSAPSAVSSRCRDSALVLKINRLSGSANGSSLGRSLVLDRLSISRQESTSDYADPINATSDT